METLEDYAWYGAWLGDDGQTHPVGPKKANAWERLGFYDFENDKNDPISAEKKLRFRSAEME
ncbi:MAG: hypothetical protein LBT05_06695 [Planctomycetaceae bacterium]|nr:hypothetical protein [Planctomycetaceae bacterium]